MTRIFYYQLKKIPCKDGILPSDKVDYFGCQNDACCYLSNSFSLFWDKSLLKPLLLV